MIYVSHGDGRRIKSQVTEGTAQNRQHSAHWQARVKCIGRLTSRSKERERGISSVRIERPMPATAPKGKARGQCSKKSLEIVFSVYLKGNVLE